VASVFYLTHTARLSTEAAGERATLATKEVAVRFGHGVGRIDPGIELNPADYIVAATGNGTWLIRCPVNRNALDLSLKISGLSILFNYNLLVAFAFPILGEKWKEKALWLKGVMEREMARKAANRRAASGSDSPRPGKVTRADPPHPGSIPFVIPKPAVGPRQSAKRGRG
jgi:hypothetical protein